MNRVKLLIIGIGMFMGTLAQAQHTLKVVVTNEASGGVLRGANLNLLGRGGSTDLNGQVFFENLPAGKAELKASFVGFRDTLLMITLPVPGDAISIALSPAQEELEEVVISSTRNNRRIEDLPLKVEVLGKEEMDEESTLVPGNIASILGDLAVITIQRTNPVNGNDAIRMQGLDPQYTLIAKDGLPLYGGFSGSLGVLSIPPLDLRQVEIIKGSVSTLYGGGAIAGMINFISKTPTSSPQRTLLFNVSSLGEKNINTFFSGKISEKTGYTLFAGANVKSAVDVNHDGFTEVPQHEDFILHPRFFFTLGEKAKLNIGLTSTLDNRRTGDKEAVEHGASALHPYLRVEKTFRNVLDLQYDLHATEKNLFSIKSAISTYQRELDVPVRFVPGFRFRGSQYASYTEASNRQQVGRHTIVTGANLITESFRKAAGDSVAFGNYDFVTTGLFVQDDWDISDKFMIEAGWRIDHHNYKGFFSLPRIALFYRPTEKFSFRLASGAGYKTPSALSLVDPNPALRNNIGQVNSERSTGVNADINYNFNIGENVEVSINQAFYFAEVKNPLRVITDTLSRTTFMETQRFTSRSLGTDTYVKATWKQWELYLGYNHTEALQQYGSINNPMPFNPKDKFSTTLAFAVEGKWRTGIESSYLANQYVYDKLNYFNSQTMYPSTRVPNFWFWAAMVERKLSFGSIILNVENLFDARQAKFGKLVEGKVTSPTFHPVWAPLDGRVVNLSVKVNL